MDIIVDGQYLRLFMQLQLASHFYTHSIWIGLALPLLHVSHLGSGVLVCQLLHSSTCLITGFYICMFSPIGWYLLPVLLAIFHCRHLPWLVAFLQPYWLVCLQSYPCSFSPIGWYVCNSAVQSIIHIFKLGHSFILYLV